MKKLFIILIIFQFTASFAQDLNNDDYEKARKIISKIDSIYTQNGIQENIYAEIGGIKQWINVRGKNKNNPIILFIHGGPASPLSSVSWIYQKPLEEYFTVVNYDQRGVGKTYLANDTLNLAKTMLIDQFVDDALEITELIEKKYNKKKIFIIGHSWGTIIGMKAAIKKPELFHAYIGMGQVINAMTNEKLSYEYGLVKATEFNNQKAISELMSIYPYPGNTTLTFDRIILARKWAQYYGGLSAYRNNSDYYFDAPLLYPNYSLKDVDAINLGVVFTLGNVIGELLSVDFSHVTKFPIPVIMLCGRYDYTTPNLPTIEWIGKVNAPFKKIIWFENSAHLIPVEEQGKMLLTLINEIKPLSKK